MNKHVKPVLLTALTLTIIASVGATLLAATNLLTAPIIASNAARKEQAGLAKIFGESAIFAEPHEIKGNKLLSRYYDAAYDGGEGRVYCASGNNAYGSFSMLVGLTDEYELYNICVLENGQSYGQMLQDNYLNPLMNADDKVAALGNVHCGATFGAELVKGLVNASISHYKTSMEVSYGE